MPQVVISQMLDLQLWHSLAQLNHRSTGFACRAPPRPSEPAPRPPTDSPLYHSNPKRRKVVDTIRQLGRIDSSDNSSLKIIHVSQLPDLSSSISSSSIEKQHLNKRTNHTKSELHIFRRERRFKPGPRLAHRLGELVFPKSKATCSHLSGGAGCNSDKPQELKKAKQPLLCHWMFRARLVARSKLLRPCDMQQCTCLWSAENGHCCFIIVVG